MKIIFTKILLCISSILYSQILFEMDNNQFINLNDIDTIWFVSNRFNFCSDCVEQIYKPEIKREYDTIVYVDTFIIEENFDLETFEWHIDTIYYTKENPLIKIKMLKESFVITDEVVWKKCSGGCFMNSIFFEKPESVKLTEIDGVLNEYIDGIDLGFESYLDLTSVTKVLNSNIDDLEKLSKNEFIIFMSYKVGNWIQIDFGQFKHEFLMW